MTPKRSAPFAFLELDRNGRFLSGKALDHLKTRLASGSPPFTDVFIFCPGWLDDPGETKALAGRFFSALQGPLALLGDRVTPFRVAIHWPSRPFADEGPGPTQTSIADREIPLGPEEECELDALLRRRSGTNGHALSVWVTKKRAGEVGARFGREYLAPLWAACLPARRRRLHLIGHSFGARLVTSAVLGGVRPWSLTLVQAPFSAFAFAGEVPGSSQPGLYHRVIAGRLAGRIVVVRSVHDPALTALYPLFNGASQMGRPGRLGRSREVVAASALGLVGARGVGAPEVEIREAQRLGLPLMPVVNVEASAVIRAHAEILHPHIANIILMAAGLLVGGPDGPRPRPEGS